MKWKQQAYRLPFQINSFNGEKTTSSFPSGKARNSSVLLSSCVIPDQYRQFLHTWACSWSWCDGEMYFGSLISSLFSTLQGTCLPSILSQRNPQIQPTFRQIHTHQIITVIMLLLIWPGLALLRAWSSYRCSADVLNSFFETKCILFPSRT